MTPLEIALVILVVIWTLIFIIIAFALIILLSQVKRALDRVDRILKNAEDVSEDVSAPLKMFASGISSLFSKGSIINKITEIAKANKKK